jgi:parvulin-like peptidyl-prolyl isomerase
MSNFAARIFGLTVAGLLAAALPGCGTDKAQPVSAQDFYARPAPITSPISPLDRPGAINVPGIRTVKPGRTPQMGTGDSLAGFNEADLRPSTLPTTVPSVSGAAPATQPALATDEYMTLGGVVMVVNGTPIYANKVRRLDANILRGYAKQMDLVRFQDAARTQIEKTVEQLKEDELEVAAAERTLDPKDIQIAHALTTLWSQNQIAQAGGSEQVVRLRAKASGEDFEDQEEDQFRSNLQRLYYWRKIYPQIQISAEDMRRYYRAHIDEFTSPTQATIILIETDPARLDGNAKSAQAKLRRIRERALAGEDFAGYGQRENDLPGSTGDQGNGGNMTIKPNSFVLTNVEAAVWKTPAGQISDVIEDHDAYFIFKVLTRQDGGVRSFADAAVQRQITDHLTKIQFQQWREAEVRRLEAQMIASPDERIDPVVEMAMQNYSRWAKE